ncbi:MAG: hypothetical protein F6K50_02655 [Moorea sp. SIO3I7]|nr:hypothetical protein [Moorena sp. SIO3I7]
MSYQTKKLAKLCRIKTDNFSEDLYKVQLELGMTTTQAINYTLRKMLPELLNKLQNTTQVTTTPELTSSSVPVIKLESQSSLF